MTDCGTSQLRGLAHDSHVVPLSRVTLKGIVRDGRDMILPIPVPHCWALTTLLVSSRQSPGCRCLGGRLGGFPEAFITPRGTPRRRPEQRIHRWPSTSSVMETQRCGRVGSCCPRFVSRRGHRCNRHFAPSAGATETYCLLCTHTACALAYAARTRPKKYTCGATPTPRLVRRSCLSRMRRIIYPFTRICSDTSVSPRSIRWVYVRRTV